MKIATMVTQAGKARDRRGFSLIELLIVMLVLMVVTALALPSMTGAITTFRLRGSVSSLAGILQQGRITAVKSNRVTVTRIDELNQARVAWVDINYDDKANTYTCLGPEGGTCTEPLIQLQQGVTVEFDGPPVEFPAEELLGYTQKPSPKPFGVGFNQRGLPCYPEPETGTPSKCGLGDISTTSSSSNGFLYHFKITSAFGDRWAALTITPAGRIRVWTLSGKTWS